MTTVIEKCRNLIGDILKTDGRDVFSFDSITSSKIFTLTEANVSTSSVVVKKNGSVWSMTPVAGSGVAWTRTSTVVTITKLNHGLITGDIVIITVSSSVAALPLASYTVTKLTANAFTVAGLNAGATSGTCTYTVTDNYSYSSTTCEVTILGTLAVSDSLEVDYSYYQKYSDNEISGFIKAAVSYLAIEKYGTFTVKSDNVIFPTPNETEENLLAIVASIIIRGDVISYRTPELTITFARTDTIETKIKKFVRQCKKSYGYLTYIDLTKTMVYDDLEDTL